MFWHASVCLSTPGGGGYPGHVQPGRECPSQVQVEGTRARSKRGGGTPARSRQGGYLSQVQAGGYPSQVQVGVSQQGGTPPQLPPIRPGQGGYPGRTTEGVLNTRRSVCLLRSRRRTFLFICEFRGSYARTMRQRDRILILHTVYPSVVTDNYMTRIPSREGMQTHLG